MVHLQPKLHKLNHLQLPATEDFLPGNQVHGKMIICEKQPFSRIDFIFDAGSRYQSRRFVAQMTNSMLKEGTPNYTSAKIAEHFDFYGSYIQPFSDRDEAGLVLFSLNKHLQPSLDLVIHLLSHASFPAREFETNKINKIRSMEVDNERGETLAYRAFFRKLFGTDHPYGEMGEVTDLKALQLASLPEYKKAYYGFDNLRIMITSSEPSLLSGFMERCMQTLDIRKDPVELHPIPAILPETGSHTILKKEGAVQAAIRMGIPLFSRNHPDFHDLSILVTILGGYFGSRLMKNLREEKGYTYGVGSGLISLRDHGYLTISTTVGGEVWQDAMDQIVIEMQKLTREEISNGEVKLVQNYLTGDLQRRLDGPYALADTFRTLWLNNLDFSHITDHLNHINLISSQRLKQIAQQYLGSSDFITVVCTP